MKKIIVTVTNDLNTDQRVHKVCTSLTNMGFNVLLVGRKLEKSFPLQRKYKTYRMDLFFNKGFLFYAEYNFRLFFYLFFKKKEILLANDLDTLLPNFLISKLQRKKLVYDSHELFTQVPELITRPKTQKVWLRLENWLLPKLKNTYTVCQSIATYYNKKHHTNFKVVRNIPVLTIQNFELEKQKSISKTIIYQGALNLGRGLELMIDTMQYLDQYKLLIVGDGDITDQLKKQVKTKKLNLKVKFLGRLTPNKLREVTPKAHLGISFEEDLGLNYRFALPNKIFDYVHANIPVLVSDLPEMKQLVTTYNLGEIIAERNPKIIANQIIKMLAKEQDLIVKNLKKASQELCWSNEEKTLQNVFNNLM